MTAAATADSVSGAEDAHQWLATINSSVASGKLDMGTVSEYILLALTHPTSSIVQLVLEGLARAFLHCHPSVMFHTIDLLQVLSPKLRSVANFEPTVKSVLRQLDKNDPVARTLALGFLEILAPVQVDNIEIHRCIRKALQSSDTGERSQALRLMKLYGKSRLFAKSAFAEVRDQCTRHGSAGETPQAWRSMVTLCGDLFCDEALFAACSRFVREQVQGDADLVALRTLVKLYIRNDGDGSELVPLLVELLERSRSSHSFACILDLLYQLVRDAVMPPILSGHHISSDMTYRPLLETGIALLHAVVCRQEDSAPAQMSLRGFAVEAVVNATRHNTSASTVLRSLAVLADSGAPLLLTLDDFRAGLIRVIGQPHALQDAKLARRAVDVCARLPAEYQTTALQVVNMAQRQAQDTDTLARLYFRLVTACPAGISAQLRQETFATLRHYHRHEQQHHVPCLYMAAACAMMADDVTEQEQTLVRLVVAKLPPYEQYRLARLLLVHCTRPLWWTILLSPLLEALSELGVESEAAQCWFDHLRQYVNGVVGLCRAGVDVPSARAAQAAEAGHLMLEATEALASSCTAVELASVSPQQFAPHQFQLYLLHIHYDLSVVVEQLHGSYQVCQVLRRLPAIVKQEHGKIRQRCRALCEIGQRLEYLASTALAIPAATGTLLRLRSTLVQTYAWAIEQAVQLGEAAGAQRNVLFHTIRRRVQSSSPPDSVAIEAWYRELVAPSPARGAEGGRAVFAQIVALMQTGGTLVGEDSWMPVLTAQLLRHPFALPAHYFCNQAGVQVHITSCSPFVSDKTYVVRRDMDPVVQVEASVAVCGGRAAAPRYTQAQVGWLLSDVNLQRYMYKDLERRQQVFSAVFDDGRPQQLATAATLMMTTVDQAVSISDSTTSATASFASRLLLPIATTLKQHPQASPSSSSPRRSDGQQRPGVSTMWATVAVRVRPGGATAWVDAGPVVSFPLDGSSPCGQQDGR
ncbi:Integrator complex subunit 7 [Sorochytrium milnesiophthora]